ncbi:unnamed protein product [Nezara viridula]|uniref:Uncharacterized protein n=1 Tax=Nezara viridula TaxID=85310 RepID=A0A9P0MRP5_NEZVI|nr:unnamed protein product [Nezara viridula]
MRLLYCIGELERHGFKNRFKLDYPKTILGSIGTEDNPFDRPAPRVPPLAMAPRAVQFQENPLWDTEQSSNLKRNQIKFKSAIPDIL